jgi:hypothetical protein
VSKFWNKEQGYDYVRVAWDDVPEYDPWGEPFLLMETRRQLERDYLPHEREARMQGKPIQGKGAARGGKVPVELVVSLVNKIQRGAFENDYKKYPRTSKEFLAKLTSADKNYKKIFEKVKDNVKDIGVTYAEFTTNVTAAFNMGGAIATNATCKLMGLEFLYFLLTIKENQMSGMITDMAYLAQKKNIRAYDTFGPFIKIS